MPTTIILKVVHPEYVKKDDTNNNNKIVVLEIGTRLLGSFFYQDRRVFENKYKK
ncbi:hypothetical protein [Blattabacterium cuenoti]|uniref:hypothetical protein n=1 Tax=Blattabacterium cuenoti TaxID=1653831 RepID=UPI00311E2070